MLSCIAVFNLLCRGVSVSMNIRLSRLSEAWIFGKWVDCYNAPLAGNFVSSLFRPKHVASEVLRQSVNQSVYLQCCTVRRAEGIPVCAFRVRVGASFLLAFACASERLGTSLLAMIQFAYGSIATQIFTDDTSTNLAYCVHCSRCKTLSEARLLLSPCFCCLA